jgi:hypothetical protein
MHLYLNSSVVKVSSNPSLSRVSIFGIFEAMRPSKEETMATEFSFRSVASKYLKRKRD